MEWFLHVDQELLADPDIGRLDLTDAVILSAVREYQREVHNENLKHIDGFVWLNHRWFMRQFPLLRLGGKRGTSTVQVAKRFRKLVSLGLLDVRHSHLQTVTGIRKNCHYRTSPAFERLAAWYKARRDIFSNQELSAAEKASRLQRHEREKPPHPILEDSTGNDKKGPPRPILEDSTLMSSRTGDSYTTTPISKNRAPSVRGEPGGSPLSSEKGAGESGKPASRAFLGPAFDPSAGIPA